MIPSRSPSTDSSFVDVSPPLPVLPPEPIVAGLELGNCRTCSPASELPGSHPEPSAAGLTPPTVSTAHPCSTTSTTILQGSMMPATDEQPTIHTGLPVLPPFQGIDATAAAPPMPSHFNEPSDESPIALATTAPRRAQPAPPPARGENETPSAPPGCALPGLPELPLFPTADAAAATAHTPTPSAAALDLFPPACYQSNPRCSGDAEAWAAAINEPGQGLAAALVASTPGDRPPSAPHSS